MKKLSSIPFFLRKSLTVLLIAVLLCSPAVLDAEEIINDDCTVNEALFEREWRKYSDFDERIPPESCSWEVQQYNETQKRIDELNRESFMLQAEMEFDRHVRLELREVKQSLVNNLRANLVKSFFRLSFLTADAIKTGVNLGQTYAKLFTAGVINALPEGLSYLKDAMDVVTGLTPDHGDSELAKEVNDRAGDLEDILKVVDSPKNIAGIAVDKVKGKAEEKLGQLFPSVDDMKFSEEEVQILRNQNLRNRAIDDVLMESYRINSERRNTVQEEIPAEIRRLEEELARWELEEKARVRDMLVSSCEDRKDGVENGSESAVESELARDEGVPGADGLSGHWVGYSIIVKVYDAAGLTTKEIEQAIGASLPHEIYLEMNETGQFTAYSTDTNVTVPLNVEGRALNYYAEFIDPHDGSVFYEKMSGEVGENGTVITGTADFGMPSSGPLFTYSIRLEKQD